MALEEAGLLAGYWAGVPSRDRQQRWIPAALRARLHRYGDVELPDAKARWLPLPVVLRRMSRAAPAPLAQRIDFLACRAFDWQVAASLRGLRPAALMACEISALSSFRAARAVGTKTILDAASVHFAVQDRVTPRAEGAWLHDRIVAVTRAEIALADHVLTVSPLAREGYVAAGCAPQRVHEVTVGADIRLFSPGETMPGPDGPCVFVFAGATTHRKGVDWLLEAFLEVDRRLPQRSRLVFAGPRGDAHARLESARSPAIELHGPVAQARLVELLRRSHCFVLPSRHDSFGMAVVEAMACGVPALVSDMVGAKVAIEEERSGWVVPLGDVQALARRMAWCVENRAAVAAMRPAARAAAEAYSWERYRARLVQVVGRILAA